MGITLREASEKVGVTRQTLMKAIKTGRVSGQKSDNGEWRIERSEEHTSELQSLMRISYAVLCLKKKKHHNTSKVEYYRSGAYSSRRQQAASHPACQDDPHI